MANASADDSFEVVLKLFGTVSHFERGLVHSYARAIGVDSFAVLYDLGGRSNASNLTESERSSLPKAYRTCFYSFQLARARFSAFSSSDMPSRVHLSLRSPTPISTCR